MSLSDGEKAQCFGFIVRYRDQFCRARIQQGFFHHWLRIEHDQLLVIACKRFCRSEEETNAQGSEVRDLAHVDKKGVLLVSTSALNCSPIAPSPATSSFPESATLVNLSSAPDYFSSIPFVLPFSFVRP